MQSSKSWRIGFDAQHVNLHQAVFSETISAMGQLPKNSKEQVARQLRGIAGKWLELAKADLHVMLVMLMLCSSCSCCAPLDLTLSSLWNLSNVLFGNSRTVNPGKHRDTYVISKFKA